MNDNSYKPEVRIKTKGPIVEIFIDGNRIEGVKGYRLSQDVRENHGFPVLNIDVVANNLTLDTACLPELPDQFKPYYRKIAD